MITDRKGITQEFFSNFRRQRMDVLHEMRRKKGKLLVQGSSVGLWTMISL